MATDSRQARAAARREAAVLVRTHLKAIETDLDPIQGPEALSLVHRLTRESWRLSGRPFPAYDRATTPFRFVPGRLT